MSDSEYHIHLSDSGDYYGITIPSGSNARKLNKLLQQHGISTSRPMPLDGTSNWVVHVPSRGQTSFLRLRELLAGIRTNQMV